MPTAVQNANHAATILENTTIPQGSIRLVNLNDDSTVRSACCMGILSLHHDPDGMTKSRLHNVGLWGNEKNFIPYHISKITGMVKKGNVSRNLDDTILKSIRNYIATQFGKPYDYEIDVSSLNDNWCLTFLEIAQIFREFPEVYFNDTPDEPENVT